MPAKYRTKAQKALRASLSRSVKGAKETILGNTRVKPAEMREALAVYFEKAKYDPIKLLIDTAKDADVPIKERIGIHKEFLRYMAPSLKSIDIQQQTGMNIQVIVRRFGEEITDIE